MDKKIKPYGYVEHLMLFETACFDPRLQNATRIILGLIIRHTQQDGISKHFSIYRTAQKQGISRQAVQNQVKKLKKFGYIEIYPAETAGHRNQYKLLLQQIKEQPATQSSCPLIPATQLDCLPATSESCPPATSEDCPKKIEDNIDIKKEKNVRVHDDFLDLVKEEIEKHAFQEIGNLSEEIILIQATACWQAWDGDNNFPKGNPISKFKGWLRTGLRKKSIKETSSNSKNSNALHGEHITKPENPIQDWHERIRHIVGDDVYKAWFRPCWYDENENLYAPTQFSAQRIEERYKSEVHQVLPNVSIVHQPYKENIHEKPL